MDQAERERDHRYVELMDALTAPGPLRLTPEGIAIFAAAFRAPQSPDDLSDEQRHLFDDLVRTGLLDTAGRVTRTAWHGAHALQAAPVLLQIKAVRGRAAATWTAWVGQSRAFVAASGSPALGPGDDPFAAVGPYDADGLLDVEIVVPGWAPICATRWLGVSPRPEREVEQLHVDSAALERRLSGERIAAPGDAPARLRTLWAQPLLLWAASTSPGDAGLLTLDAGAAGFWQVRTEGAVTMLFPRSAHQVWRDIMRLMVDADAISRAEGRT